MNQDSNIKDGNLTLDKIESIRFENISLNYKSHKVLNNLNFQFYKQDRIAFVGNSGGGKSSIINLLLRFYDTSSGVLYINGVDIKKYNINSLRKQIAFVSQRVYIFKDSLLNNIAYGDKNPNREKALKSLLIANGESFLKKLKFGIDTELEEFGLNLSGGERQRVALARAIYRDSSLLILDEATSALDNKVEEKILKDLQHSIKNKIVITIAHRLSTIYNSDSILFLNGGQVIANGKHSIILKISKSYRELNRIEN
jgi:subfamily B ATP-binding cassette protein MsbA